jgi:hypothetical protein
MQHTRHLPRAGPQCYHQVVSGPHVLSAVFVREILAKNFENAHARSQIGSWLFLARITLNCGRDDVRCLRRIAHECNYAHIYISDSTVWQRLTKQADSFDHDTPPPHGHPTPIRYSPHPLRQRRLVHHNDVLKPAATPPRWDSCAKDAAHPALITPWAVACHS